MASDIVRDKKLDRAKKSLQGKQVFKTESLDEDNSKILEDRIPYENDDTKPITFETNIYLNNYTNIDKYIIGKIIEYIRQDNTINKNVSVEQVDKIIAYVFQNGGTELLNKFDDIIYKGMENILET